MPMGLAKQCRPGSQQGMQPIFIAAFTEDLSLCPLLCLQQYEETPKELKPKDGSQQLLIGTVAPHKPVASSTIARWLKEVLNASGVDVSQSFKLTPQGGLQHLQLPWLVLRPRPSWNRQDGHSKISSADITAVKAMTAIQQQQSLKLCWKEGKGKSTNIQGHVDQPESSEIQLRNGKGCLQLHAIPGCMRREINMSPSFPYRKAEKK